MPADVQAQPSNSGLPGLTMPWRPLLQGDERDRALETVAGIAETLLPIAPPIQDAYLRASLAGGSAGLAILAAYLDPVDLGLSERSRAERHLRQALATVAEGPVVASLHFGLAGVAWAAAHLQERFPNCDTEAFCAEVDETLAEYLKPAEWAERYDLLTGLVGLGVYALERLPRPAAVECLERVVDHLAALAQPKHPGVTWWTDPATLPEATREQYPHGYYDLGLAHGVPGIIALLGQACAAGVAQAKARLLLDGAVRWLLSQQQTVGGREGFPPLVGPGAGGKLARAGWCYGEPGIAVALLGAARGAGEPAWEQAALAIARRAAVLSPEQAGVQDASLCHGAAGLGHLFNRMYQATGDSLLGEAARFWFRRTLDLCPLPGGSARCAGAEPKESMAWEDRPIVLMGDAGVALALAAACASVEPAWDQMLLVTLSPPQPTMEN
jgi:hypothetical protein